MHMFFGDSHSRKFKVDTWGNFSFNSFSGATIRGLNNVNSKTQHGSIVQSFTNTPFQKHIYLMFGQVDLDFTYFRDFCTKPDFDEQAFFSERVATYVEFVAKLKMSPKLSGITILAPEVSPLADSRFVKITSRNCGLSSADLEIGVLGHDVSQRARNDRTMRFNDLLKSAFEGNSGVSLVRVDHDMVSEDGIFKDLYRPSNPDEHHSNGFTLRLWAKHLQKTIPWFEKLAKRTSAILVFSAYISDWASVLSSSVM